MGTEAARYAGCPTGCGIHLDAPRGSDADNPHLDERDAEILGGLRAAWLGIDGPRVGDYVRFADTPAGTGRLHRFSADHRWSVEDVAEHPGLVDGLQTSPGGSFHLGPSGHMSMSGSLDRTVPRATITDTGETRLGSAWFFHHDRAGAHRGVDVRVPCRIYATTETAPKKFNVRTGEFEAYV